MPRLIAVIIIISLSFSAHAYRCKNKLISNYSSMHKALKYCGEPSNQNSYDRSYCRMNRLRGVSECIQIKVDVLTYTRRISPNRCQLGLS